MAPNLTIEANIILSLKKFKMPADLCDIDFL